jgi:hypothetical protein
MPGSVFVAFFCALTVVPSIAEVNASYQLQGWQPAQSDLVLRSTNGGNPQTLTRNVQRISSLQQICLKDQSAPQTLVQVQPTEGGDARFLVLGGQKPHCQPVGAGWKAAAAGDAAWFRTLFSLLDPPSKGVRISASTSGATRGGISNGPQPADLPDPCGLYPTAGGTINLPGGTIALTLGTRLPDGSRITLQKEPLADSLANAITVTAAQSLLRWPPQVFQASQRWRLSLETAGRESDGTAKLEACHATVVVQPATATPLGNANQAQLPMTVDEDTRYSTQVAALLDDGRVGSWHAWLLSTLIDPNPEQAPATNTLNGALWNNYWANRPNSYKRTP